jgi:hypothetical protein
LAGEHEDRATRLAGALQLQHMADPNKAVEAHQTGTLDDSEMLIKGAPTSGAALKLQVMLARADNASHNSMQDWAQRRAVKNIENQLVDSDTQATHDLGSLMSTSQVARRVADHLRATAHVRGMVESDPQASADKVALDVYKSWLSQRSAVSPLAALNVITQLTDPKWQKNAPKGFNDDDRQTAIEKSYDAMEGFLARAKITLLASHADQLGDVPTLVAANSPKAAEAVEKLTEQTLQERRKDQSNPAFQSPLDKEWAKARHDSVLKTLEHTQTPDAAKLDAKATTNLLDQHNKLFAKSPSVDVATNMEKLVDLRQSAVKLYHEGKITHSLFETINGSIDVNLPARKKGEVMMDTGSWWHQNGRQIGVDTLNILFAKNGKYGSATPEQQNLAQEYFMRWVWKAKSAPGATMGVGGGEAREQAVLAARMAVEEK